MPHLLHDYLLIANALSRNDLIEFDTSGSVKICFYLLHNYVIALHVLAMNILYTIVLGFRPGQ